MFITLGKETYLFGSKVTTMDSNNSNSEQDDPDNEGDFEDGGTIIS
jgi:hypothetical protein